MLSEMLDTTPLQRLYKHYRHVMFRVGDDNQHLAVNLKFKYECVGVQGWNCGELIGGSCAGTSCSTCLTMMMTVRCTSSTTRVSARARCVLVGLSVWSWQRSWCFRLPTQQGARLLKHYSVPSLFRDDLFHYVSELRPMYRWLDHRTARVVVPWPHHIARLPGYSLVLSDQAAAYTSTH